MIVSSTAFLHSKLAEEIKKIFLDKGIYDPKRIYEYAKDHVENFLSLFSRESVLTEIDFEDFASSYDFSVSINQEHLIKFESWDPFSEFLLYDLLVPEADERPMIILQTEAYTYYENDRVQYYRNIPTEFERQKSKRLWIEPVKFDGSPRRIEDYRNYVSPMKTEYKQKVLSL